MVFASAVGATASIALFDFVRPSRWGSWTAAGGALLVAGSVVLVCVAGPPAIRTQGALTTGAIAIGYRPVLWALMGAGAVALISAMLAAGLVRRQPRGLRWRAVWGVPWFATVFAWAALVMRLDALIVDRCDPSPLLAPAITQWLCPIVLGVGLVQVGLERWTARRREA